MAGTTRCLVDLVVVQAETSLLALLEPVLDLDEAGVVGQLVGVAQ